MAATGRTVQGKTSDEKLKKLLTGFLPTLHQDTAQQILDSSEKKPA
jgi:hypothetical protein